MREALHLLGVEARRRRARRPPGCRGSGVVVKTSTWRSGAASTPAGRRRRRRRRRRTRLPGTPRRRSRRRARCSRGRLVLADGAPANQASSTSPSTRLGRRAQRDGQDVGVVPAAGAVGRGGVGAQRGADAGHLVGGDRRPRPRPAAHDALLGPARGHVAGGRLRGPGPVVALVLGQRPVQHRLVTAAADLLHDGAGDPGVLVGGDGDPHGASMPQRGASSSARAAAPPSRTA